MPVEIKWVWTNFLHHLFKIDQEPLSKLLIKSQQTFTYSKSTRETLEVGIVLMSLFLPLNIIPTIFESILLTSNRKISIWITSSDCRTISIYIYFFCCQVQVQAILLFKIISIGMFQKEAILLLLGYVILETT